MVETSPSLETESPFLRPVPVTDGVSQAMALTDREAHQFKVDLHGVSDMKDEIESFVKREDWSSALHCAQILTDLANRLRAKIEEKTPERR